MESALRRAIGAGQGVVFFVVLPARSRAFGLLSADNACRLSHM
jgi:hypothetical protein